MKMNIRSRDYEENALAIMELPFVKKLVEENKKLKTRNKALKNLIYSLPEFRHPANVGDIDDSDVEIVKPPVKIKKEPIVYEIEEKDDDTVDPPKSLGDLTKCEYAMNSFTSHNNIVTNKLSPNSKKIYTDDCETVFRQNVEEEVVKLCVNMDCERYPPDWDFEEDTEETYQEDQWKKCCLCDGYFDDNGMSDILFVQEEPNNQEAECNLCGKTNDIVQMKGCGQYLCGDGCDEEEEED